MRQRALKLNSRPLIHCRTGLFILSFICQLDINCRTPDVKNSTEEDHNHDVAGNRRAVQLPANIFLNPNQNCYTQFFIQGTPPTGLRTQHLNQMRYICQERPNVPGTYYYATMHDERLGIAVYSAYVLRAGNINFQAQGASAWVQTPGNLFTYYLFILKHREDEE